MTLAEAIAGARAESDVRKASDFDQASLDEAAKQGFAEGAFEESEEEGAAVVEEFYQEAERGIRDDRPDSSECKLGLSEKLRRKSGRLEKGALSFAASEGKIL
jgi:hypothetical protein